MTTQGSNSPTALHHLRFQLLADLSITLTSYNCSTELDYEPQGDTTLYIQYRPRPGARLSVGAVDEPNGWVYIWSDGHCPVGDLDAAARQIVRLLSA
jgi:hypothetical protein